MKHRIKQNRSMQTRLTVCILVLLCIFMSVVYILWLFHMRKSTEETLISNTEVLLQQENTLFEKELSEVKKLILQTAVYAQGTQALNIMKYLHSPNLTQQQIYEYRKQIMSYLVSCYSYQKYIHGLTIADLDGTCLTYGLTYPIQKILEENWYDVCSGEKSSFTYRAPYYQDGVEHKTSHVFAVVYSMDEYREIRVAELKYEMIDDIYQRDAAGMVVIVNGDTGEQIYCSRNDMQQMTDMIESGRNELSEKIRESETGRLLLTDGKQKFIGVYDRISDTHWYSMSFIEEREIVKSCISASTSVLAWMAFFFVILSVLVIVTIYHYTKNIKKLTKAVKNIDHEKMKLDICIESGDEIEELYVEFESMLDRIEALIESVKIREKEKKKSEIAALQYQINPHFMYNSLNTIKYLASINGMTNIKELVDSFMKLMYINMATKSRITVEEECQYLKDYISIQSYRFIDRIDFRITEEEKVKKVLLPKLLLQPLVENALLHGIAGNLFDGYISVDFSAENGRLKVIIEDNGVGMSKEKIDAIFNNPATASERHIGVKNVYDRIKLNYGEEGDFVIYSEEGIKTQQIIWIPMEREHVQGIGC